MAPKPLAIAPLTAEQKLKRIQVLITNEKICEKHAPALLADVRRYHQQEVKARQAIEADKVARKSSKKTRGRKKHRDPVAIPA